MPAQQFPPPKPVTEIWRPDLVKLPQLTFGRRAFRRFLFGLSQLVTLLTMRVQARGLDNFPKQGPAVIVFNHLGDADAVVLMALFPYVIAEGLGKIELHDHWLVGPAFRAYGIIWVHRGRPDRRALRAALDGLARGRMVALAPEGRQTVTGGLEEGNEGAAFLALRSGAPVVPIALTGTENQHIYDHLKKLKRAPVSVTVGRPFLLAEAQGGELERAGIPRRREILQQGTRRIMKELARLLPESYRGTYGTSGAERPT